MSLRVLLGWPGLLPSGAATGKCRAAGACGPLPMDQRLHQRMGNRGPASLLPGHPSVFCGSANFLGKFGKPSGRWGLYSLETVIAPEPDDIVQAVKLEIALAARQEQAPAVRSPGIAYLR